MAGGVEQGSTSGDAAGHCLQPICCAFCTCAVTAAPATPAWQAGPGAAAAARSLPQACPAGNKPGQLDAWLQAKLPCGVQPTPTPTPAAPSAAVWSTRSPFTWEVMKPYHQTHPPAAPSGCSCAGLPPAASPRTAPCRAAAAGYNNGRIKGQWVQVNGTQSWCTQEQRSVPRSSWGVGHAQGCRACAGTLRAQMTHIQGRWCPPTQRQPCTVPLCSRVGTVQFKKHACLRAQSNVAVCPHQQRGHGALALGQPAPSTSGRQQKQNSNQSCRPPGRQSNQVEQH